MTQIDKTKDYIQYAFDVLDGKIAAGKYIKLACQRYIDWFSRDDIYFDYDEIEKKKRFINKMKHYQGEFNGKYFDLMGWESWVLSNIWCWKWVADGTNVTNRVLISMARKNAKTALCAAISLCHVVFDENGAEVDFIANSTNQAAIAMDHTLHFAKSLDTKGKVFKRYRNTIKIPKTDSIIQVQSSDTNTKDGYNSSLFITDEFQSAKSWELYNVFISSMGMRRNPCAIVISSAGFLLAGFPFYDYVASCKSILDNETNDDTQFSAIYQMDDEDDYTDEKNWVKSNPSLDVTVKRKYLKAQITMAKNQAAQETAVKTKNFNMWCSSKDVWIRDELINNSMIPIDLSQLHDEICYVGVDLSSTNDLTSVSIMFPPNEERDYYPDKYIFKTWLYIPQYTIQNSINNEIYKSWKNNNQVFTTSGEYVDYDEILRNLLKYACQFNIQVVAYDAYNATQFANNAEAEGLNMATFSQGLGNFNKPTKLFEILLGRGQIIIDKNAAVRWCFSNAELKYDNNDNAKPIKSQNIKSKKIDAVISMLECLGAYLAEPNNSCETFFIENH